MASRNSVVEYFAEHEGYKCGYCGSKDSNFSHGMWAHSLACEDYEALTCRGWRRSGKYLYKPTMDKMCCPSYVISCEALNFKASKSQKKVMKRMTKFLTVGQSRDEKRQIPASTEAADESNVIETPKLEPRASDISPDCEIGSNPSITTASRVKRPVQPGKGPNPAKSISRKAKVIRLERKQQKLAQKLQEGPVLNEMVTGISKKKKKNQEKSIEDLIVDSIEGQSPAHKFEVRTVRSSPRSSEFNATFKESFAVYAKYQTTIHKDSPSKCTEKQFTRFLVDSPLIDIYPEDGPSHGYGSFHQQYVLDGTIIAVGVIDILPHFVSSVYLYYDPDYAFLSLGTYSALREIAFTRSLNKISADLQHYIMGFYIHSCPKMRYKGDYSPSALLCPQAYTWVPLELCVPKLEVSKYSRLDASDKADETVSVSEVMVLYKRRAVPYHLYTMLKGDNSDEDQVEEYAGFVGKTCAKRLLLYRD